MRTLTLIRHAKSSWSFPGLDDQDRPLNRRGQRDAPLMGRVLAVRGFHPDLICTSLALRALRTAETIAQAVDYPVPRILLDPRLYHGDSDDLLKWVQSLDDRYPWVAGVGHNPGLNDLVDRLAREAPANVPTCGVVEMGFACDRWADVGRDRLDAFDFDFPKRHAAP
jgi:phosphohistidine phosphatase